MWLNGVVGPISWLVAALGSFGLWRYQLISKRRYEVAEQALNAAGAAVAALHYIRRADNDARAVEGSLRPDPFMLKHGRIQESDGCFRTLDQASKEIAMHFGDAAAKELVELCSLYNEVSYAHLTLHHRQSADILYPSQQQKDQWEQWKRLSSYQGSDDPITTRIDDTYARIKGRFAKYLRPTLWRLFLPYWD